MVANVGYVHPGRRHGRQKSRFERLKGAASLRRQEHPTSLSNSEEINSIGQDTFVTYTGATVRSVSNRRQHPSTT